MKTLSAPSPAKINLTLRVLGVRTDGFHDIESLTAKVELCDTITVTAHEDGCYALDCDDPTLPRDGSNLVLQAAKALAKAAGVNCGAAIGLQKRIPAGTGLGGGSSDAATTLRLLNDVWDLRRPVIELEQIGAGLGSDVPLFFHRPFCVIRGRGEQIVDVPTRLPAWAVLILPALHCSTAAVYAAWDRAFTAEKAHRPIEVQGGFLAPAPRPSILKGLEASSSAEQLSEVLFNDLEAAAFEVVPELRRIAEQAARIAGGPVRMTGSGSGLFRLFDDEAPARRFAQAITTQLAVRTEVARLAGW